LTFERDPQLEVVVGREALAIDLHPDGRGRRLGEGRRGGEAEEEQTRAETGDEAARTSGAQHHQSFSGGWLVSGEALSVSSASRFCGFLSSLSRASSSGSAGRGPS